MDTRELEILQKLVSLFDQVAASANLQRSKVLYEMGFNYYQANNFALAIPIMTAAWEIEDAFYSTYALLVLKDMYKKLADHERERETLERIADLPPSFARFIAPQNRAVLYQELGNLDAAKEYYLEAAKLGAADDPTFQSNLTELLLLRGDIDECIKAADRLLARNDPTASIIGRLYKGLALSRIDRNDESTREFQALGSYLLSLGAIPGNFTWDFRDVQKMLGETIPAVARPLMALLEKKISFQDFRNEWVKLNPAVAV